jgi:hypothetical protein
MIPAVLKGGTKSLGKIALDAVAGPLATRVLLTNSLPATVTVPAYVLVPAGAKVVTFAVTTKPVAAQKKATVTAKLGVVSKPAVLTINP